MVTGGRRVGGRDGGWRGEEGWSCGGVRVVRGMRVFIYMCVHVCMCLCVGPAWNTTVLFLHPDRSCRFRNNPLAVSFTWKLDKESLGDHSMSALWRYLHRLERHSPGVDTRHPPGQREPSWEENPHRNDSQAFNDQNVQKKLEFPQKGKNVKVQPSEREEITLKP